MDKNLAINYILLYARESIIIIVVRNKRASEILNKVDVRAKSGE